MNKQEVIEKIERRSDYFSSEKDYDRGYRAGLDSALLILRELDEPEKPVLNKYEAEWVEGLKKEQELRPFTDKYSMLYFITRCGFGYGFSYDHKGKVIELTHYHHDNHVERERLMNAFLYGYEVEKEKLYTVELPNPKQLDYLMLQKDRRGKISVAWYCTDSWREDERVRLTEAEIKKDFNWAWQFAKRWKNDC